MHACGGMDHVMMHHSGDDASAMMSYTSKLSMWSRRAHETESWQLLVVGVHFGQHQKPPERTDCDRQHSALCLSVELSVVVCRTVSGCM